MKPILCLILLLSLIAIPLKSQTPDSLKYRVITDKEFIEKYKSSPGSTLIDARGPKDYHRSRIAGARNIEWPLPDDFFAEVSAPPKDRPVFIYCYVGNRSRKVAVVFFDHGYHEVYSLKGGFNGWKTNKMPVERKKVKIK